MRGPQPALGPGGSYSPPRDEAFDEAGEPRQHRERHGSPPNAAPVDLPPLREECSRRRAHVLLRNQPDRGRGSCPARAGAHPPALPLGPVLGRAGSGGARRLLDLRAKRRAAAAPGPGSDRGADAGPKGSADGRRSAVTGLRLARGLAPSSGLSASGRAGDGSDSPTPARTPQAEPDSFPRAGGVGSRTRGGAKESRAESHQAGCRDEPPGR
jgi:hypothetical protein